MKTSFIIGWTCLFISLLFFDSIIQQNSSFSSSNMSMLQRLMQPTGTDVTVISSLPVIGGAASLISYVWNFFKIFIQMIFLYFPSIWNGQWIWVWYFLCVPVTVGFVASIVIILRGVHNG